MNETNNLQRILDLQRQVARSQTMLERLFVEALQSIGATRGFLAFEDPNGYLSILISEGQFWHLRKTEGITGQAFSSDRSIISGKQGAPPGVKALKEAYSEMAIPVRKNLEVVGAMFFDNTSQEGFNFGEGHQALGERYAGEIRDVLDRKEPWGFRSWWTNHQMRKLEVLAEMGLGKLRTVLSSYPRVSGAVFLKEGQRHGEPILGDGEDSRDAFSDPVEDVLNGVPSFRNEKRTLAVGHMPFPTNGPVCGYIKVYGEEGALDGEMERRLGRLVDEASFDALSPAATTIQFPEEHYFNMIYDSLANPHHDRGLHGELESIGRQVNALCRATTRILYRAANFDAVDPENVQDYAAVPVSSDVLESLFVDAPSTRPHYRRQGRWLSTPVFAGNELVASVDIATKSPEETSAEPSLTYKQSLDDDYNGPFSENVAVLVRRVYCRCSDLPQG